MIPLPGPGIWFIASHGRNPLPGKIWRARDTKPICPSCATCADARGSASAVIAPMFPRYLFIHLNRQTDNWGPIRSTLGVVSIVRFGREAARVPDDLVAALRSREDTQGIQILPIEEYKPGSRVRITQGGFAGYEGIFQAASGRDRVTVLLDMLGRDARTTVDTASIEPA